MVLRTLHGDDVPLPGVGSTIRALLAEHPFEDWEVCTYRRVDPAELSRCGAEALSAQTPFALRVLNDGSKEVLCHAEPVKTSVRRLGPDHDLESPLVRLLSSEFQASLLPEAGRVTLTLKTLIGRSYAIPTHLDTRVSALKCIVQSLTGQPPDQQRLIAHGKQFEDDRLLSDYISKDGDTMHLVLRLRGGMLHYTSGRDGKFRLLASQGGTDKPVPAPVTLVVGHKEDGDRPRRVDVETVTFESLREAFGMYFE